MLRRGRPTGTGAWQQESVRARVTHTSRPPVPALLVRNGLKEASKGSLGVRLAWQRGGGGAGHPGAAGARGARRTLCCPPRPTLTCSCRNGILKNLCRYFRPKLFFMEDSA